MKTPLKMNRIFRRHFATGQICALLLSATSALAIDAILTDDSYTATTSTTVDWGGAGTISLSASQSPWLKFNLTTLPAATGSQVAKATLTLFISSLQTGGSLNVRRPLGTWNEATLTGANNPGVGSIEIDKVIVSQKPAFVSVDITQIVRNWLDGVVNDQIYAIGGAGFDFVSTVEQFTPGPTTYLLFKN